MRIAICDDEEKIASVIEGYVTEYEKEQRVRFEIEVFTCGKDLIESMERGNRFDLIFLDIVIKKDMNGVAVAREIRNRLDDQIVKIVFTSAYKQYDRQLFDYQPMNFLSKPVEREKLFENIDKARKLLNLTEEVFVYKVGGTDERCRYGEIMYFESMRRKTLMHMKQRYVDFYESISDVEERVKKYRFIRCHRSYIVNYDYVKIIERDKIIMTNDESIPIGKQYNKAVRSRIMKYEMEGLRNEYI